MSAVPEARVPRSPVRRAICTVVDLLLAFLTIRYALWVLQRAGKPFAIEWPCYGVLLAPVVLWFALRCWEVFRRPYSRWHRAACALSFVAFAACIVTTAVLLSYQVPLRRSFEQSRAALEHEAERILQAGPKDDNSPRDSVIINKQLGAWYIERVDVDYERGDVYFCVAGGFNIRPCGVVRLGENPPADSSPWMYTWDAWYLPPGWKLFASH